MIPSSPRPPFELEHAPFYIVVNGASGSADFTRRLEAIRTELELARKPHEFFVAKTGQEVVQRADEAVALAVRERGVVVAAGGDGTINAVANALLSTECPLGVIGQGTFNFVPRAHGMPDDPAAATRALLQGSLRPFQVGLVNGRAFLVNAAVGLHPEILEEREAYKARFGRTRTVALGAGISTLLRQPRQLVLEIEHDDQKELVRTPSLFVGNNSLQLERLGLEESEQQLHEHKLAAVLVRPVSTAALFGLALRGALGTLGEAENVRQFAFRSMQVRPVSLRKVTRLKVALDGEVAWLDLPLRFHVAERALTLLTPPSDATERQEANSVGHD